MADVQLRNSLLATLAYFDLFEYPLTMAELLRLRFRVPEDETSGPCSTAAALAALSDTAAFGHKDGYWFLAGHEKNVTTRQRRFRLAEAKRARARKVTRFLKLLPSVRMVAICNSLAIANADTDSDIDLFVICRSETLWITRLLVVSVLAALGLRPDERTHADRVCMSFFVSENATDLSRFALTPDDTYLRYWIATLDPMLDRDGTFAAFTKANAWIRDRIFSAVPKSETRTATTTSVPEPRALAAMNLSLLRATDRHARRLQMRMFPKEITSVANLDSRVVVSDDVLKFHVVDRRAEFERRFRQKLDELGVSAAQAMTEEKIPALAHA